MGLDLGAADHHCQEMSLALSVCPMPTMSAACSRYVLRLETAAATEGWH
jgi:hypothetical protein